MKKIMTLLIFLILFGAGFFAGFLYGRLPTSDFKPLDSDSDGYADNVDDGPYDSRYHEKNKTAELELNIVEQWTTKELAPFISPEYTGLIIYMDTSGPDIEVELFTESYGNISSVWRYDYNGMDSAETHEHFYFFARDPQEQFNKLVITNPAPTDSFEVKVIIYAIK